MTDDELSKYLPVHGDRLRLRQYLRETQAKNDRKNKLLKVLHEKVEKARKQKKQQSSSDEEETMRRPYGNKNAVKGTRNIEIGWIHKTGQRNKQVRSKTGGGTRKIAMPKYSTKADILVEAKRLFFPNDESPKGHMSNYEFDIWDFSERQMREGITVQEMYEEIKMPLLRFYLATWNKEQNEVHDTANGNQNTPDTGPSAHTQNVEDTGTDIVSAALDISGIDQGDFENPEIVYVEYDDNNLDAGNFEAFEIPGEKKTVTVRVHRGHALIDMITAFKTINLKTDKVVFEMIMPNGAVEVAEDGGGVTRDCLTEFWVAFYEQCTIGTTQKIPFLRHDYGEEEWKAVGTIICFGWTDQGYFPLQLALPFMEQCLFGKYKSDVLDSYYKILPDTERACMQSAVSDFNSVDQEELIDILDMHEVRNTPNQTNIARIVQEIAHKELIQTPMFVADCWYTSLRDIGIDVDHLSTLYTQLVPTSKAVCKLLSFPQNMTADETTVCNHLKRFVRELTVENLRKFLRFCTGSDLLITKAISVAFVNVSGLARRPVGRTCANMLELSRNYDNYPQFRSEFLSVLESNVWVMDII